MIKTKIVYFSSDIIKLSWSLNSNHFQYQENCQSCTESKVQEIRLKFTQFIIFLFKRIIYIHDEVTINNENTWKITAGKNIATATRWQYFRRRILSILLCFEILQNRKTDTQIIDNQQKHNRSLLEGSEKTKLNTLLKIGQNWKNPQLKKNRCFNAKYGEIINEKCQIYDEIKCPLPNESIKICKCKISFWHYNLKTNKVKKCDVKKQLTIMQI